MGRCAGAELPGTVPQGDSVPSAATVAVTISSLSRLAPSIAGMTGVALPSGRRSRSAAGERARRGQAFLAQMQRSSTQSPNRELLKRLIAVAGQPTVW